MAGDPKAKARKSVRRAQADFEKAQDMLEALRESRQVIRLRRARGGRPVAEGVRRLRTGWECVHVCIDDATRLAYVEVLPDEKARTVMALGPGRGVVAQGVRPI